MFQAGSLKQFRIVVPLAKIDDILNSKDFECQERALRRLGTPVEFVVDFGKILYLVDMGDRHIA